jgi:hypothetical protein
LSNEKNLTKRIQSLLTLILQRAKKALFLTTTQIISRSMQSKIPQKIPHTPKPISGHIIQSKFKKNFFFPMAIIRSPQG